MYIACSYFLQLLLAIIACNYCLQSGIFCLELIFPGIIYQALPGISNWNLLSRINLFWNYFPGSIIASNFSIWKQYLTVACNYCLQLFLAIISCNYCLQFFLAIIACNYCLQLLLAIIACNYFLQLLLAIIACNYCLQKQFPNNIIFLFGI